MNLATVISYLGDQQPLTVFMHYTGMIVNVYKL